MNNLIQTFREYLNSQTIEGARPRIIWIPSRRVPVYPNGVKHERDTRGYFAVSLYYKDSTIERMGAEIVL